MSTKGDLDKARADLAIAATVARLDIKNAADDARKRCEVFAAEALDALDEAILHERRMTLASINELLDGAA